MRFKLLFLLIAVTISSFPQGGSIYTRYGLGDPQLSFSARRHGLGDLGTAVADEDFIGTLNPAGWNRLTRTRIEFGVFYYGNFISDNSSKKFYANSRFTGFTIAFPASTLYGIGITAGMVPVTSINYKVNQVVTANNNITGNYDVNYEGEGGLSKVFIGSSYRLPFDLSLGATLEYFFGNLNYYSRINFPSSNTITAEYDRRFQIRGLSSTIGLISPDLLPKDEKNYLSDLRLGVAFNVGSKGSIDTLLTSSSSLRKDTVSLASVDMKIPFYLSIGGSIMLNKRYLINLDYFYQPWKDLAINNVDLVNLRNMMKVSAGIEYKPLRELGSSFWQQVMYRFNASYEQTQYQINGTGIDRISFGGGVSFPFSPGNTLDIGLEYYIKGTTDNNLYKENGFRMSFGLSLGDIWFIREER